jgi:hypothetical protein
MIVHLDLYEQQTAAQVGMMRVFESIHHGESWGHNYTGNFYQQVKDSVSGAMAEFAVAKYFKIKPQIHVNHGAAADIMFKNIHIQVKSQTIKKPYPPKYYIRQTAQDHELFCFVIDKVPQFEIKGFIFAKDIIHDDSRLTDFGFAHRPQVYLLKEEELKPFDQII